MNAQELILGRVLPIAAAIAVFWIIYRLLFTNSNRLKFNRLYILLSIIFALSLPMLGLLLGNGSPQIVNFKQDLFSGIMLQEIIISPDGNVAVADATTAVKAQATTPAYNLWQILAILYFIGLGVSLLLLVFKLLRMFFVIVRSPKEKCNGYTAVYTGKNQGSFSFLNYAFFPEKSVDSDIVRHELSHIAHRHSWDIIFIEVMMVLQWFNPFIYLFKRDLQCIHEYQADRDVVNSGTNKRDYMMLILQQCTAVDFSRISNNFSLILTKKRIKMITMREKTKGLWWRLLVTLPVLAVMVVANTNATAKEQNVGDLLANALEGIAEVYEANGESNPLSNIDTLMQHQDGTYSTYKTIETPDPVSGDTHKNLIVTSYNADGKELSNLQINGIEANEPQEDAQIADAEDVNLEIPESNDSIYEAGDVEVMPEFPGGNEAMMKFIQENTVYPENAKKNGIGGRTFVSFTIEKDGSIVDVKVLRGCDKECDAEAVRVVKSMPKWKPGKVKGQPVRVHFMMPFVFKVPQN